MTTQGRDHIRWLRNSAPYINAHRGKTFVLMVEGVGAQHENFANLIHDIALLNSLGVRLVLIHGARLQIDQRLQRAGVDAILVGEYLMASPDIGLAVDALLGNAVNDVP